MNDEVKSNGAKLIASDRVRVLAKDLNVAHGLDVSPPPIVIVSDGTAGGTMLMVHGQIVQFNSLNLDCHNSEYGAGCSMSVTVREKDGNGAEISRTMTLRKYDEIKAALAALTANKDKE